MSEQTVTETKTDANPAAAEVKQAEINLEEIIARTKAETLKELQSAVGSKDSERLAQLEKENKELKGMGDTLKRLRSAFSPEDKDKIDPITQRLLLDPKGTLNQFGHGLLKEIKDQLTEEKKVEIEEERAYLKTLGKRPDITQDEDAYDAFTAFLSQQDSSLPAKEQYEKALAKFDKFMESKAPGYTAKLAADAASGSTDGGASASERKANHTQSWASELEQRQEAFRKKRGL